MSLLKYTGLRVLVLLVVGGLLFLSGLRGLLLVALAFVLSGIVSLVLLRRARTEVSHDLVDRIENRGPRRGLMGRISERIEAANRSEDEALDASADAGDATDGAGVTGDDDHEDRPQQ